MRVVQRSRCIHKVGCTGTKLVLLLLLQSLVSWQLVGESDEAATESIAGSRSAATAVELVGAALADQGCVIARNDTLQLVSDHI